MNSVFINQTWLKIVLTSGVNITGATGHDIYYRTPAGAVGHWPANVEDEASGILSYTLPAGTSPLLTKGKWKFWNWVEMPDGRIARGETYEVEIFSDQL